MYPFCFFGIFDEGHRHDRGNHMIVHAHAQFAKTMNQQLREELLDMRPVQL
jgi:hypothetical protein